jgi:hypothetical protein
LADWFIRRVAPQLGHWPSIRPSPAIDFAPRRRTKVQHSLKNSRGELRSREPRPGVQAAAVDVGPKGDAHGDDVEVRPGVHVDDRSGLHRQAVHPLPPAVLALLLDLEREALEHAVRDEGAQRREVLGAPAVLRQLEGAAHAHQEARLVEVRVRLPQRVGRDARLPAPAARPRAPDGALLKTEPAAPRAHRQRREHDDQERHADHRVLDRELDQEIDQELEQCALAAPSATAAAATAEGTPATGLERDAERVD